MQGVNLIPAARRNAATRAARLRMWFTCAGGYAIAVLAVTLLLRVVSAGGQAAITSQIQANVDEIAHSRSALAAERKGMKTVLAEAEAAAIIYGQPDWSILMGLIAQAAGGEIVLRNLRIAPATPASSEAQTESPDGFVITVSGLGKSQSAVSACVLRLERTGLLDQVKLMQSRREPFLDSEAVAFDVECSIATRSGDHSQTASAARSATP